MAQAGDFEVHLEGRQLAALAWLGPLRDLDLQFAGGIEIFDGDAEASGGDLLDGGIRVVAVRIGLVALGPLAALTGVRGSANAVHGDGQHLMRLG